MREFDVALPLRSKWFVKQVAPMDWEVRQVRIWGTPSDLWGFQWEIRGHAYEGGYFDHKGCFVYEHPFHLTQAKSFRLNLGCWSDEQQGFVWPGKEEVRQTTWEPYPTVIILRVFQRL